MAEIINLRTERKNKKRKDKEIIAEQNRVTFGLSKHDKKLQKALTTLEQKKLDGHLKDSSEKASDENSPSKI